MLEVCVDTVQAAIQAEEAGADRIELCSGLDLGGVTPSGPLTSAVRRSIQLPLIVLIRCRAGHFFFDPVDCELMLQEAKEAIDLGADGIAIGGLTSTRELDLEFLQSVVNALPNCQRVMHRAFDQVLEQTIALGQLVELGFTRILTSGGPNLALDGVSSLRQNVVDASGRIEVLPAGGVSEKNALEILTATGANQLHGSFRKSSIDRNTGNTPDPSAIRKTKAILSSYNQRSHNTV